MSSPLLELRDVTKQIKGKTIIHPLTYQLGEGRVLALCGGNGAGKSTLLRMIAGILLPSGGTVQLRGIRSGRNQRAYTDQLGYMPDDFQFGYSLTAAETLEFYAALRGLKGTKRVDDVLEEVGLADVRNKKVATFSKGMRQRLLFGQALLAEPPLLVLDEPTNGLDPYWMRTFVELVNARKQRGQSIVFSTHNLEVAELTADEVILLNEGRVEAAGSLEDVAGRYGTAGLVGAFLNRLPEQKQSEEGKQTGKQEVSVP